MPLNVSTPDGQLAETTEEPQDLISSFYGYLAAASMVPNVTFLILNAFFGHKLKTQPRLIISLIFVILMFTFTAVMVKIDTDTWQYEFLIVTLVSVVFINVNAAIFQGGILGVAGKFPPAYMGAVFSGQAVGGIFASGCNVVFLAMGATALQSGFFCFLTSVVFLLTALVAYGMVTRSEFYQHHLGEVGSQGAEDKEKKPEDSKLLESNGDGAPSIPVKVNPFRVLIQISPYAAAVLLCFLVTLGCFPAITAQVDKIVFKLASLQCYNNPTGCVHHARRLEVGGHLLHPRRLFPPVQHRRLYRKVLGWPYSVAQTQQDGELHYPAALHSQVSVLISQKTN